MYIRALKPDEQAGIEAGFSLLECLYPVPEKPTPHPLDICDSYPLDEKGTLYRPAACRVHVSDCLGAVCGALQPCSWHRSRYCLLEWVLSCAGCQMRASATFWPGMTHDLCS